MTTDEMQDGSARADQRTVLMQISNEMVRLYKSQFGRGPTKARTNWAGPDTLISTLENSLTPVEKNMVKLGDHARLRDMRMFFQYATEREFREIVERLTGREVRAFVSGIDTQHDVSSEVFYFKPNNDEFLVGDFGPDGSGPDGSGH